ncbi:MAG: GcrA cell cycle regulator [Methylobacterium frigidaeris]
MVDAGPSWTKERVELLRRLWIDGRSASQIAAEIGGVSRNAVIGKVHRLGLAGRVLKSEAEPAAPAPLPTRRVRADEAPAPAGRPATVLAPAPAPLALVQQPGPAGPADVALPVSERVTIMELRESMCRWPMGDPATPDFRFCGARSITGLPYCTHHASIAYQPAAERKRDRRVAGFR